MASSQSQDAVEVNAPVAQDPDFKLPKLASLVIVLLTSGLLQVSSKFHTCNRSDVNVQRYPFSSSFRLPISMRSIWEGLRHSPV